MCKRSQVNCSDYNRCYLMLEVNFLVNNIYLQYPTFYIFLFPYYSLVFPPNLYNINIIVSTDCVNSYLFSVTQAILASVMTFLTLLGKPELFLKTRALVLTIFAGNPKTRFLTNLIDFVRK